MRAPLGAEKHRSVNVSRRHSSRCYRLYPQTSHRLSVIPRQVIGYRLYPRISNWLSVISPDKPSVIGYAPRQAIVRPDSICKGGCVCTHKPIHTSTQTTTHMLTHVSAHTSTCVLVCSRDACLHTCRYSWLIRTGRCPAASRVCVQCTRGTSGVPACAAHSSSCGMCACHASLQLHVRKRVSERLCICACMRACVCAFVDVWMRGFVPETSPSRVATGALCRRPQNSRIGSTIDSVCVGVLCACVRCARAEVGA